MKKYALILGLVLGLLPTAIWAQKETVEPRIVKQATEAEYFQSKMEGLYKAIRDNNKEQTGRYEREISNSMRRCSDEFNQKAEQTLKDKFTSRLEEIHAAFDHFTFVGASKEETDQHLALLEEFLAIVMSV